MPLRVAFNATPLLSPLTGIGNYIVELGVALAATGSVDAYSFYRYRWRHERPTPREPGRGSPGALLVDTAKRVVPFRASLRHAAKYLGFRGGLGHFRIDIYHEQNYVPLSFKAPVVITIHDLSWIRYPESHPIDRVRWLERGLPRALDKASVVLVDSEFVRREVLTTFGLDATRVLTAHLGVKKSFGPRTPAQTASALHALGLAHGRYVLTVGTIEPRKNLRHALDAFELLPEGLRKRYPLVIAGARGWQSSGLVTRLRRLDSDVRFLGEVSQKLLPDLYAGAALFLFPSLYEGFGLPPLEAMASGVPVVVSRQASMPEVVGDAGEVIDPFDPQSTAARLIELLDDEGRRGAMAQRGLARAAEFTWDRCATRTLAAYRLALGQ